MAEDDNETLPVTEPRRSRDGNRTDEPEEGESGDVVSGAPFEDGAGSDGDPDDNPEDGAESDRDGFEREPTDWFDGEPDAKSVERADSEPGENADDADDTGDAGDAGDGDSGDDAGDSEAGSGDDAAADLDEDLDGNTTADLDGDSDESGSPGAEDASEGGSGDHSSDEKTTLDRVKAFARTHKRPLIVATVLLVSLGVAGGGIWYCYDRTETAQAAEARHLVTYGNERDLVNETMAGAKTILDGDENGEGRITTEQVTDPATLDALDTANELRRVSPFLSVARSRGTGVVIAGRGNVVGTAPLDSILLRNAGVVTTLAPAALVGRPFDLANPVGSLVDALGGTAFCLSPEQLARALDRRARTHEARRWS